MEQTTFQYPLSSSSLTVDTFTWTDTYILQDLVLEGDSLIHFLMHAPLLADVHTFTELCPSHEMKPIGEVLSKSIQAHHSNLIHEVTTPNVDDLKSKAEEAYSSIPYTPTAHPALLSIGGITQPISPVEKDSLAVNSLEKSIAKPKKKRKGVKKEKKKAPARRCKGRLCEVEGCTKGNQGNGKCIRHGGGKRCTISGCTKSVQTKGLCKAHGGGTRRKVCTVSSCVKKTTRGLYCLSHQIYKAENTPIHIQAGAVIKMELPSPDACFGATLSSSL